MFLTVALAVLAAVLQLAIAVTLVRKYVRTKDVGFVWLGMAVVIWPFMKVLVVRVFFDRFIHGQLGFYPFSLVEHGQMSVGSFVTLVNLLQQLIGFGLLLVAVLYLCKAKSNGSNRQAV
jgi:hypothetical protein